MENKTFFKPTSFQPAHEIAYFDSTGNVIKAPREDSKTVLFWDFLDRGISINVCFKTGANNKSDRDWSVGLYCAAPANMGGYVSDEDNGESLYGESAKEWLKKNAIGKIVNGKILIRLRA
tara:strand:- start:2012 stop:2371 length:360 start_codon:yes stop_codon:yes gene_type:complete